MKKTIVFALLVALMMSIALPVTVAADSKEADKTDLLPGVTASENVTLLTAADEEALSEDQKAALEGAKEALSEDQKAALEGAKEALKSDLYEDYSAKYIFYCLTEDAEAAATAEFEMTGDVLFQQFVDGKWSALDSYATDNGLSVTGIQDAPMVIFVKNEQ